MYFDLGSDWDVIKSKYNLTERDMFYLLNVPALDEAISSGKNFNFTHSPIDDGSTLRKEYKYILRSGKYKYYEEENILNYVG